MKPTTCLFILIGLLSCGQVQKQTDAIASQNTSAKRERTIQESKIKEPPKPMELPTDVKLDTLEKNDVLRNLSTFIVLPVSGVKPIDKAVSNDIVKQKNSFLKSLDEMLEKDSSMLKSLPSDFHAAPVSIFKDEKITSYLFIVSYYPAGAPHPMTMYCSLNFDNKTRKRIFFNDYFKVNKNSDIANFADLITKAVDREGVFVSEIRNNIDFSIEKDTISFCFDDYEIASYAEGIIQGRIAKYRLYEKINPVYR